MELVRLVTPTPTPPHCSDRRHGGRVFGDIVDTFGVSVEGAYVDGCDPLGAEEGLEEAVPLARPQRDGLAGKRLGDLEHAAEEADMAALLDAAHEVAGGVVEGDDGVAVVARADLVAAGGHGKADRLVRAFCVVDGAPALEGAAGGGKIGKGRPGHDLGLERAVETLVLAVGLRMARPGMADPDVMLDQPHAERRERTARPV